MAAWYPPGSVRTLKRGDRLQVQAPAGRFVPKSLDQNFLLFAGGSGVTPLMSITKAALAEGSGKIVLINANRDQESVIFRDELMQLSASHPDRLAIIHWLETVQQRPSDAQLSMLAGPWIESEIFVCGPQPFMDAVTRALQSLGVAEARIHIERFLSLPDEDPAAPLTRSKERLLPNFSLLSMGVSGAAGYSSGRDRNRSIWMRAPVTPRDWSEPVPARP